MSNPLMESNESRLRAELDAANRRIADLSRRLEDQKQSTSAAWESSEPTHRAAVTDRAEVDALRVLLREHTVDVYGDNLDAVVQMGRFSEHGSTRRRLFLALAGQSIADQGTERT